MAKRIAAVILGGLLTIVQIQQIPQVLAHPASAEAIGYAIAWIAFLAAGIYMLLYGFKIIGMKSKTV